MKYSKEGIEKLSEPIEKNQVLQHNQWLLYNEYCICSLVHTQLSGLREYEG